MADWPLVTLWRLHIALNYAAMEQKKQDLNERGTTGAASRPAGQAVSPSMWPDCAARHLPRKSFGLG